MVDGGEVASVIDIDSFVLQGELDEDCETASSWKRKAADDNESVNQAMYLVVQKLLTVTLGECGSSLRGT